MAEAIDHDGVSAAATAGSSAVKWGAIGAVAAVLLPVALGAGALFAGYAAVTALASLSFGTAIGAGLLSGLAAWGAVASAGAMSVMAGGAAIGGGLFGLARGGQQVGEETAAHRNRMASHQLAHAKQKSDHQIQGIQEGYVIGRQDGEQVGFRAGQQDMYNRFVAAKQQQLAQQQQQVEQQQKSKPDIKIGNKVIASCACSAESIANQREAEANAPKQVG